MGYNSFKVVYKYKCISKQDFYCELKAIELPGDYSWNELLNLIDGLYKEYDIKKAYIQQLPNNIVKAHGLYLIFIEKPLEPGVSLKDLLEDNATEFKRQVDREDSHRLNVLLDMIESLQEQVENLEQRIQYKDKVSITLKEI